MDEIKDYKDAMKFIQDDDRGYFAAKKPKLCVETLFCKIDNWYKELHACGYLNKIRDMYAAWHGGSYSNLNGSHMINFGGEDGELTEIVVNHMRNIGEHMKTMTVSNRPALETRAVNVDYKSQVQTKLGNGLLDYYMREVKLEKFFDQACEYAIVLAAGWVKLGWNANKGKVVNKKEIQDATMQKARGADIDIPAPEYEGDVEFQNLSPLDVIEDINKENDDQDWRIARTFKSRFDLIAAYPEFAEEIMNVDCKPHMYDRNYNINRFGYDENDDIPVFEFYHRKSEALPDGRYILFVSEDAILYDGPLPYRKIPLYSMKPSRILGTPLGYTILFDLLPLQEAANMLYSTILSNQAAFGVQNILIPTGANIEPSQIAGGLNILKYNPQQGKPEALQLTATPAEVFNFLNMIINAAETVSGINSVVRGNPEANLRSAQAIAMIQSNAIQYMSGLQSQYVSLMEDVGLGLLEILIDYAHSPRIASIVGKNDMASTRMFKGDDLSEINRVVVDVSNPLTKCLEKGTEILMFDGSIKKVEDIKVGEKVMGPDSKERTVFLTGSGTEMMYKIRSKDKNRKVEYGTNSSHILTLRYCSDHGCNKKGDLLDIEVKDFIKLPKYKQNLLQGFKTGVEFPEKELSIPPYILGLWLGDGNSRNPALTSMDSEIVNEWFNYAESLELKIRIDESSNSGKAKTYYITSEINGGIASDRNVFMNQLRDFDLIQNKHIPELYRTSSRKQRLEVLAGLIDTDGTLVSETFIITQKSDKLSSDIIFLAESLGFRVTHKVVKVNTNFTKEGIDSFVNKISIGGNTHEIPTRLARKQANQKDKCRNWLNYGIEVEEVGIGEYYGITLLEEPHFVLADFTVTHNTVAGRVNMADQLMQYQAIDAKQYMNIINTGKMETATDGDVHEQMLIQSENEGLLNGESQRALAIDQHLSHIKAHRGVLAHPMLRRDQELTERVLGHITEHLDLLRNSDPELLMTIGEQPLQGQPPAGGQPPMGGEAAPVEEGGAGGAVPQPTGALPPEMQASQGTGGRSQQVSLDNLGLGQMPLTVEEGFAQTAALQQGE